MSREKRLDRLYTGLSARERGRLILRAYKAGEQPDRLIYTSAPATQGAELNRYIQVMNAVNCELAYVAIVIREQVKQIDLKYGWMMTLLLWGMEVESLGTRVLACTKDRALRSAVWTLLKRAPGSLEAPVDLNEPIENVDIRAEGFGREMVRALLIGIRDGLQQHWPELRALEIAVDEVAQEFGDDPLRADTREIIDEAKATCTTVHAAVQAYVEPFELPEPGDDEVAAVRRLIDVA